MKIFASILLFFAFLVNTNAQVTQNVHQTIIASSVNTLSIELNSDDVQIQKTRGSRIIIETTVTVANLDKSSVLNYLVELGRYELQAKLDASTGKMVVSPKVNKNTLVIKGKECKEFFNYKILVPESIPFVQNDGSTASK